MKYPINKIDVNTVVGYRNILISIIYDKSLHRLKINGGVVHMITPMYINKSLLLYGHIICATKDLYKRCGHIDLLKRWIRVCTLPSLPIWRDNCE